MRASYLIFSVPKPGGHGQGFCVLFLGLLGASGEAVLRIKVSKNAGLGVKNVRFFQKIFFDLC